jgi:DNA-binding transcriptional MerR regulator
MSIEPVLSYSIKDLENISGIKAHTLRIWEQRYNLFEPNRTDTNIRLYSNSDMRKLLNVALLNNNGVKISKIAELSNDQLNVKASEILVSQNNYQNQIEFLVMSMIDMNESKFEEIISENILSIGLVNTIENIVYPFLIRVGVLWQTNSIHPGQEHFMSNLIRQKLISAIDSQSLKPAADGPVFMLFLPDNELHEISLIYYNFLLRELNYQTIYLGQSVPFKELIKVAHHKKVTHALSVFTSGLKNSKIEGYLSSLSAALPEVQFFLSGYQLIDFKTHSLSNVNTFKNLQEFKSSITELNQPK